MSKKYQLSFSKKYRKLESVTGFKTVRWTDALYQLGKPYNVVLVANGGGRFAGRRYPKGTARIVKAELAVLKDLLNADFTRQDADCEPDEYYEMMLKWYSQKPDWKAENSQVQILTCQWLTKEGTGALKSDFAVQKQLSEATL